MNFEQFKDFERKTFETGAMIFRENDPGEVMYIIISGRVAITKQVIEGVEKTLGILDTGEYFGEMSLLLKSDRTATARAIEQTVVIELTREDFKTMLQEHFEIGINLLIQLAHRLEKSNEESILLALELELTKRKPDFYPSTVFVKEMVMVAAGSFDAKHLPDILRLRKNVQWDSATRIVASLIKPGQSDDALLYIIETENAFEIMKLTVCFKDLVRWNIAFAVSTDEEILDHYF